MARSFLSFLLMLSFQGVLGHLLFKRVENAVPHAAVAHSTDAASAPSTIGGGTTRSLGMERFAAVVPVPSRGRAKKGAIGRRVLTARVGAAADASRTLPLQI